MCYAHLVIGPAGSGKMDEYSMVNFIPLDLRKENSLPAWPLTKAWEQRKDDVEARLSKIHSQQSA
ncbi:hypothetical protein HS088_TW22G00186 [Tripterygium wilfordii]|uniref:Uncharacterized protein n=1 Tax=Tripterygium wilfordii TaxID=458696 RepID=A0A7J7BXF6_TRIWF|nr:hypothetical protein HS088_TW22G00186 [Tripterygium wilfordii]